jgi:hypothetical protein
MESLIATQDVVKRGDCGSEVLKRAEPQGVEMGKEAELVPTYVLQCRTCGGPHFRACAQEGELFLQCAFCANAAWDPVNKILEPLS